MKAKRESAYRDRRIAFLREALILGIGTSERANAWYIQSDAKHMPDDELIPRYRAFCKMHEGFMNMSNNPVHPDDLK